jgi:hypothetical protein
LNGRPIRLLEDNTKLSLRELGCEGGNWIKIAEDRAPGLVLSMVSLWGLLPVSYLVNVNIATPSF